MMELFGRSLVRSWSHEAAKWPATAKRKWLAGTVIFGLGVVLMLVHGYVHSPLGTLTGRGALVLMLLGLGFQIWGLKSRAAS
jgi:hypothetical protein